VQTYWQSTSVVPRRSRAIKDHPAAETDEEEGEAEEGQVDSATAAALESSDEDADAHV